MYSSFTSSEIWELLFRFSLESVLLILALVYFYNKMGGREILEAFSPRVKNTFISFCVLWALVQLVDRFQYHYPQPYSFFPLERFAMYQVGKPEKFVDTYRFLARGKDSQETEIDATSLLIDVGLPSVNTRFRRILEFLLDESGKNKELAHTELNLFAEGIVRHLNAKHLEVKELEFQILRYEVGRHRQPDIIKSLRVH